MKMNIAHSNHKSLIGAPQMDEGSHVGLTQSKHRLWYGYLAGPIAWLVVAGISLWHYAHAENEPPVYDALSYAEKAANFWHAVSLGRFFNPLNIDPTIRPFGTVFFTYPFGFHYDYQSFYFLTNFLPMVVLFIAAYNVVRPLKVRTPKQIVTFSATLMALITLPPVFQFALHLGSNVMGTWGYVDMLFGTLSALSISFLVRIESTNHFSDAMLAGCFAIVTIFVKPVGMITMAAVFGTLVIVSFVRLRAGEIGWRLASLAMIGVAALYMAIAVVLYKSAYFSPENIAYGESGLRLLHQSSRGLVQWFEVLGKVWVSFGPMVIILIVIGLVCSFTRATWHLAILAITCMFGGLWLWLGRTNVENARYFFPFPIMAAIFLLPGMLRAVGVPWITKRSVINIYGCTFIMPLLIVACLVAPTASANVQRYFGLNLRINVNQASVMEARQLATKVMGHPNRRFILYYVGTESSSRVRAFEGVMDWRRVLGLPGGNTVPALPIDWVREPAYRFDELIRADFIIFERVQSASRYLIEHHEAPGFDAEERLVRAWLTTLGNQQGVQKWSDGAITVLEIRDRARFWASISSLVSGRKWPQSFLDGITHYGVVHLNGVTSISKNLIEKPIHLYEGGNLIANIVAVTHKLRGDHDLYSIYISQLEQPTDPDGPWTVFVHRLDQNGKFESGYRIYWARSNDDGYVIRYNISIPAVSSKKHRGFAFGIYKPIAPGRVDALINPGANADWGGMRTLINING